MMAGKWELAVTTNDTIRTTGIPYLTQIRIKKDGFSAVTHKHRKLTEACQLLNVTVTHLITGKTKPVSCKTNIK